MPIAGSSKAPHSVAGQQLCGLLAVLASASLGCGDARLSEMRPHMGGGLQCWLTLNFRNLPKSGDVDDVRVTFNSVVLYQDETFDWPYMLENDYLFKTTKDWLGNDLTSFTPDVGTTAADHPAVGEKRVLFRLPSKESVVLKPGDEDRLVATLYWAGKKQDTMVRGLFTVYQKK